MPSPPTRSPSSGRPRLPVRDPASRVAQRFMTLGARHAHDPTVVHAPDGRWVMVCTDARGGPRTGAPVPAGGHLRVSDDLVRWRDAGTALDGVPAEAAAHSGASGIWAPEVVMWPGSGAFHMYYSASTFGSSTSAIGLAVAADPLGPWEHRGLVLTTRSGQQSQNAIDAAVTVDEHGAPWLTYGSFFAGIFTVRLDRESGLLAHDGDLGTCVARRPPSVQRAVEGAFVLRGPAGPTPGGTADSAGARWTMLVSFGSLFSTYDVRATTSTQVDGPYRDRAGRSMTDLGPDPDGVGTRLLVGHQLTGGPVWVAPGHCSVLSLEPADEGPSGDLLVHHVRLGVDPTEHVGQLRRLVRTRSGWPAVSPQPYAATPAEVAWEATDAPDLGSAADACLAGTWDVLSLRDTPEPTPAGPVTRSRLAHAPDGDLRPLGAHDVVVHPGYDWVRERPTWLFAGFDAGGVAISGTLVAGRSGRWSSGAAG